jgi:TonB family protein
MIVSLIAIGCAALRPPPSATAGCTDGSPEPRDVVKATTLTVFPEPVDVVVPQSEYPREALERRRAGNVLLQLLIDSTGCVRRAQVIRDPGDGLGPAAAMSALHFKFKPGQVDGNPVAVKIFFTVGYELP